MQTEQNSALVSKIHSTLRSNILNEEDPLTYYTNETILQASIGPTPYLSPKEIKPLLSPYVPLGTRKRKIQKSEVLTSTPVKKEPKAKLVKANNKVLKNIKNKDLNTKIKPTLEKKTDTT
ncbi:unnamed protein product [Parnassius apollo]|uniref:(apollo) hypothetical protein n=1 Tax=Parnassius apollo TaxID=110799 RepID=A0A8S3Y323_PARAO|nr:unnamed protein product [Parnassius apollo]